MSEMVRVNVGGKEATYLEAANGKKQTLYVDVAENRRRFDEGQQAWVDQDPNWYRAKFVGNDADVMRDQIQQGDALILWGEKEKRVRETADGKTYRETRFYVESFGIDPRLTTFSIDRSRRQCRTQEAAQTAQQGPAADAEAGLAERAAARSSIEGRLRQLVEQRHIDEDLAGRALFTFDAFSDEPDRLGEDLDATLALGGANLAARRYVVSVAEHHAGTGPALSWNEAATQATSMAAADNPWAAVQQVRQEMETTAPAGPSM